ncbi:plasmid mobilization relaxosome protein MobC [Pseudomonas sp. NMI542_15]|uniref:plasmid mobilization relaxosome protein MobC n=1 Tax=Pseudomonas sp. NMI542_15 TaxID=2903148 RepID=UPI001E65390C|nr:plasmid mobilization relaxosome protein MobC [Pseudomonas sp. NMI542_15]MCE0782882.1 MobC family plasmid mobilization relaxosome protein [Pseudomonas sp. NMI542_15]
MTEKKASKKRRGPAPRPAEQQRNHRISIFLTPAEYQLVVDKAGDYPLPDFVRNCAIDGKYAPKIPVSPVIPKLNFEAWKKLSRVANNINQIARRLNAEQNVGLREVVECLAALRLTLVDMKPHSKAFDSRAHS